MTIQTGNIRRERYRYQYHGQRALKSSFQPAGSTNRLVRVCYLAGLELQIVASQTTFQQVITLNSNRILPPLSLAAEYQIRLSTEDANGSGRLELDNSANILSHEGYYPYGGTARWATRSQNDAVNKTQRYSMKERDASGLYYYGFRYYACWIMRWINPDPAATTDGLNLLRMVRNNPATWQDPQGLAADTPPLTRASSPVAGPSQPQETAQRSYPAPSTAGWHFISATEPWRSRHWTLSEAHNYTIERAGNVLTFNQPDGGKVIYKSCGVLTVQLADGYKLKAIETPAGRFNSIYRDNEMVDMAFYDIRMRFPLGVTGQRVESQIHYYSARVMNFFISDNMRYMMHENLSAQATQKYINGIQPGCIYDDQDEYLPHKEVMDLRGVRHQVYPQPVPDQIRIAADPVPGKLFKWAGTKAMAIAAQDNHWYSLKYPLKMLKPFAFDASGLRWTPPQFTGAAASPRQAD